MKKSIKYIYAMIVVIAACLICSSFSLLELSKEVKHSDAIGVELDFWNLESGYAVRQPFVPSYNKLKKVNIYLDNTFVSSNMENLVVEVFDLEGNCVYMKKIPRLAIINYRWQEVTSGLELESGEGYYLNLSMDTQTDTEAGVMKIAKKESGRLCMQITYEKPLTQDEYLPFYLLIICVAVMIVVGIFKKME